MRQQQNYSSTSTCRFAQEYPHKACPNEVWNLVESIRKGYEVKCREPRCCYQGASVWSFRHGLCVNRLLDRHIPEDMDIFRGNLHMPQGATPADHVATRKEFLRILKRWSAKTGHRVELHGVLHITAVDSAHWDTVAYSNAPKTPLKAAVADAWRRAGGARQSLMPVEDDEVVGVVRYLTKDTTREDRAARFLPLSQRELGMKTIWQTEPSKLSEGFWCGRNKDAVWAELKAEFVAGLPTPCPILIRGFRAKLTARLEALTGDAGAYLQGISGAAGGSSVGDLDSLLNESNEGKAEQKPSTPSGRNAS